MINPLFTVIFLTLFVNCLSAQIVEEPIALDTGTGKIAGSLLVPDASKKIPVVLIIAGSGPTDRNGNNPMMTNNALKMVATDLYAMGIASFRYDKRGIAESKSAELQEEALRFENYIEDAKNWIALLKHDDRFSDIIVLGHSEGSLIGTMASQSKDVKKFISIAGIGSPASDIIREQLKTQPPYILNQALPIIESLEKGEQVENIPQMLYPLFRPSVQPYLISWFKYNPQQEIAKLDKPIMIIQGTTDIQVGVSEAEKLYHANPKSEKHLIEGMNHILKEADMDRQKNIQTYSKPDLPLKVELVPLLFKFIKA